MENDKNCCTRYRGQHPPWLAFVLIAVGLGLLLDNLDIIDIGSIWDYWPAILIVIGMTKVKSSHSGDRVGGWIFIGLGAAFLLAELRILHWHAIWSFWPLMLIAIGISILSKHKRRPDESVSESWLNAVAIFSGNERTVNSQHFEGGSITTVFGANEIDFGGASLAEGEVTLDIQTLFGGTELSLPPEWVVEIRAVPIFGGVEDKRYQTQATDLPDGKRLVVKGIVLFGGLEIKTSGNR